MDREVAKDLFAACETTISSLAEVERVIRRIVDEEERRSLVLALSEVMAEILGSIRAPAVRQYPELEPPETLGQEDTDLSENDLSLISKLKAVDLELIDKTLLSECVSTWRKVARVVGTAMNSLQDQLPEIPDGYYAQRVALLVQTGKLESQGNLGHMRFSEVRLPGNQSTAG